MPCVEDHVPITNGGKDHTGKSVALDTRRCTYLIDKEFCYIDRRSTNSIAFNGGM